MTKTPPWKDNTSPTITSLANYFVTGEGKDLFELILEVFSEAKEEKCNVVLKTL